MVRREVFGAGGCVKREEEAPNILVEVWNVMARRECGGY